MPIVELTQAIEAELAENPILEEVAPSKNEESLSSPDAESPLPEKPTTELGDTFEKFDQINDNFWDNYDYQDISRPNTQDLQKRKNYEETLVTKPQALYDFLLWQIRFLDLSDAQRAIAEEIVGNINDEGYLKTTSEEIAQTCQAMPSQVEEVLKQIQQLDPPGIGARTLQEALLIQLQKKGQEAAIATRIVANHLSLLEKRNWEPLAKILAVDIQEIKKAAEMIARLEPKPGRTFYSEEPIAVTPDASVTLGEEQEGKFKIEIHDETVPELRINSYYRHLLRNKNTDEKTKLFLREKIQSALNFIRALGLRKSTLHEITEELVRVQSQFFEKGFSHLAPLRLKDIAQQLGIHESTVSRALQGKYISTPQGTIPYKSFFSSRLETANGEAESQKSMMEKIRNLVAEENPQKPLSDQELVQILQGQGIHIARRTVAKYRDLLKILPSHLRRKR